MYKKGVFDRKQQFLMKVKGAEDTYPDIMLWYFF